MDRTGSILSQLPKCTPLNGPCIKYRMIQLFLTGTQTATPLPAKATSGIILMRCLADTTVFHTMIRSSTGSLSIRHRHQLQKKAGCWIASSLEISLKASMCLAGGNSELLAYPNPCGNRVSFIMPGSMTGMNTLRIVNTVGKTVENPSDGRLRQFFRHFRPASGSLFLYADGSGKEISQREIYKVSNLPYGAVSKFNKGI